ncbi:MAG: hypothetical protein ACYC6Y_09065 [Thermoguttaceae bacterium]
MLGKNYLEEHNVGFTVYYRTTEPVDVRWNGVIPPHSAGQLLLWGLGCTHSSEQLNVVDDLNCALTTVGHNVLMEQMSVPRAEHLCPPDDRRGNHDIIIRIVRHDSRHGIGQSRAKLALGL